MLLAWSGSARADSGFFTCPPGFTVWQNNNANYGYGEVYCFNDAWVSAPVIVYQSPQNVPGWSGGVYCGGDYWAEDAASLGSQLWCSQSWTVSPGVNGAPSADSTGVGWTVAEVGAFMGAATALLAVAYAGRVVVRAARESL